MTEQKHFVIVGASRGLGEAACVALAKAGHMVSICARSKLDLRKLTDSLNEAGCTVRFDVVDVRDADNLNAFFQHSVDQFGPISGVLHTAARYGPFGKIADVSVQSWYETVEINLLGAFNVLRIAIEMLAPTGGNIVILSGGGATNPLPTISSYAASKAGVVRLVETAALEYFSQRVFINAMAPGLLVTDMLDEVLDAPEGYVDPDFRKRMVEAKSAGGDSIENAVKCAEFLLSQKIPGLTGRLVSAKWDDWQSWAKQEIFSDRDYLTLRRQTTNE